ncbi:B12-binding domain-containing radical SAM protein [Streptomyces sp. NPDC048258]|uniref:B12-binding domain-containing radical SAM protein n=1 Tax=Streptomyces sp. NPDC048258 TaxID=3365527 RepID=UPI003723CE29
MTGGPGSDVLLVMPPVSEAVQFPYLALPQLTAAWTAQGYDVICCDLNLEYRSAVLRRRATDEDPGRPGSGEGPRPPAKEVFRRVSDRYREHHGQRLLDRSRDRTSGFDQEVAIRAIVRYVTQQATQDGWMLPGPLLMSRLDRLVRAGTEGWSARWGADRLEALLDEHRSRVLAFSVPFFSQLVPTLALCTLLKQRRPEQRIMVGGPTVQMWEKALRHRVAAARLIDHWCLGHGEDYLAKVLGGPMAAGPQPPAAEPGPGPDPDLEPGREVGLEARREARLEAAGLADGFVLNDQPMPDFGQFDFADYSNQAHQFPYRLTVGCFWGKCTFCSYGNRYHDARAFQQIAPEAAAAHLVALAARLGITDVAVTDENTGLRHLLRVMQAVRDQGVSLTFRVRARLEPELADSEFCKRLYELGCVQMSAGYETDHQDILDSLRKGQDARHAELAVGNLTAAGITTNLSFMDGFAHPAAEQGYRDTAEVIQRHPEDMGLDTMQLLVAEPGSHLWESRRIRPDDEYLITNEGLAFAAGRVGGALLDEAATEEARQRLLRMSVEAVPDAERASRPDLAQRPESAGGAGAGAGAGVGAPTTAGARVKPRFGVALDVVRAQWFLADVAWPRMAALPPGVERTTDGRLTAEGPEARRWLSRMVDKRLLVLDQPGVEGVS